MKKRPLSWSSISSFEYDPESWYRAYILKEKGVESVEMQFGKMIADSFQTDKPLAPVTLYPVVEQKLFVSFSGGELVGYMDTYDPKTHSFREFKTGKRPWTQKRAEDHGQLKMYALMLYITHKVRPEDLTIHLDWIPTQDNGDFSISFVKPLKVHSFQVKLTLLDIVNFGAYINQIRKEMEEYIKNHE